MSTCTLASDTTTQAPEVCFAYLKETQVRELSQITAILNSHLVIRAGKGALARHGDYWYPVRLLQRMDGNHWQVARWRGNRYVDIQDAAALVKEEDLVDELQGDFEARRRIRVSGHNYTIRSPY